MSGTTDCCAHRGPRSSADLVEMSAPHSKRQCLDRSVNLGCDADRSVALKRVADECLAGRLITRARLCKQVKTALETLGWRKESVKIRPVTLPKGEEEPGDQRVLGLALSPVGVRAVQAILAEPDGGQHLDTLRQEISYQHQLQKHRTAASSRQSAGHNRAAARNLLSAMLREGSVRFSLGLPCQAELGQAFPPSALAPETAARFTLPPLCSVENSNDSNDAKMQRFTFAELFAGIGGFRLGLESIGGRCILMAEQDQACHLTVRKNFSEECATCSDVTELCPADVPPHHILTAGFPCQSFSQLGARHGGRDCGSDGRLGLNDETRGNLIWHVLRIAKATRPVALILENVRGLLTLDGGETLATILSGIRAIGYCVDFRLLNSATVLAQHRERLYFVCVRDDLVEQKRSSVSPRTGEVSVCASSKVSDKPETSSRDDKEAVPETGATVATAVAGADSSFKFPWPELPDLHKTVGDILEPEDTVPPSLSLDEHRWTKVSGSSYYAKFPTARVAELGAKAQTIGSSYKRGWALYSQFVPPPGATRLATTDSAASSGSGGIEEESSSGSSSGGGEGGGGGVRKLPRFFTPREVARLQGFPDSFVLDGLDPGRLYHQLGNAVSPPIVAAVGASLIAWLNGKVDTECAAAGVLAALQFVGEQVQSPGDCS